MSEREFFIKLNVVVDVDTLVHRFNDIDVDDPEYKEVVADGVYDEITEILLSSGFVVKVKKVEIA